MAKDPKKEDKEKTADSLKGQEMDAKARQAVNDHMHNLAEKIRNADIPGASVEEIIVPEPAREVNDSIPSPRPQVKNEGR